MVVDYFRSKTAESVVADYRESRYFTQMTVQELLRTDYTNRKLREEAIESTPNDTVSRRKIWDENPQIVLPGYRYNSDIDVIRTITTKQDIAHFSDSQNNDSSNIIILCPNHHRLMHKLNPKFDSERGCFVFSDNSELRIEIDFHLMK